MPSSLTRLALAGFEEDRQQQTAFGTLNRDDLAHPN